MEGQLSFGIVAGLVVVALAFDFMNGFHDAANSISTVVSTRVLKPYQAVALAAMFNFVALFVFHLSVGRMRRVVAGLVAVVGLVAAVFAPVVMNDQSDRPMRPEPSMRSGAR